MITTHNRYVGEKTPLMRGFFVRQNGCRAGFTLTEIMMVVTILALLTTVAIPSFVQYRADARIKVCTNNLRLISYAKGVWAIKNSKVTGDAVVEAEVSTYIDGGAPSCPEAGAYTYNSVDTDPTCSYGGFHTL